MYRARVMPCLLVRGNGLVKTRKFKDPVYIGDPINAVRIFSDKEVDEIDISLRKGAELRVDRGDCRGGIHAAGLRRWYTKP